MNNLFSILKNYFIHGIVIIMLGFIFACFLPVIDVENNYLGIILAFVGIIATFIVVSNYAQVKDIENSFKSQIEAIENKFAKNVEKIEGIESGIDSKIKKQENLMQMNLYTISADVQSKVGKYHEALYNHFSALDYSRLLSESEKAISLAIIHRFINEHGDDCAAISDAIIDRYLLILGQTDVITDVANEMKDGINKFLKRLKSQNKQ